MRSSYIVRHETGVHFPIAKWQAHYDLALFSSVDVESSYNNTSQNVQIRVIQQNVT